jgi:hypothetical protein
VVGIGDQRPYSLSAAQFGFPTGVTGLRPIGLCANLDQLANEWVPLQNTGLKYGQNSVQYLAALQTYDLLPFTDPVDTAGRLEHPFHSDNRSPQVTYPVLPNPNYPDGHVIQRIWFDKNASQANNCGTDPGNWGWLNYAGGPNSSSCSGNNAGTCNQLEHGYGGTVTINDCDSDGDSKTSDTDGGPNGDDGCQGNPGAAGGGGNTNCPSSPANIQDALNCLVGQTFPILVYNTAACPTNGQGGGGANCSFNPYQFLIVKLWDFNIGGSNGTSCTTGSADPQHCNYFDFEFLDGIVSGSCCTSTPSNEDTGVKAIRICSVDHDTTDPQTHCAISS